MGQRDGTLVELLPAHDAVILNVLRHTRLADPQMIGKLCLQRAAAAAPLTTQHLANADPQGPAGFDIVVGREIRIGKNKDAGAGRSLVRFLDPVERAGHQPPQLRFETRQARGQRWLGSARPGLEGSRSYRGLEGRGRRLGFTTFLVPNNWCRAWPRW